MRFLKVCIFLFITCFISSCANVKQIERGKMAAKIMQLEPQPEEAKFLNSVNSYREGAAGGSSAVGGGCGCN
jgi:hypothetical protein